MSYDLDIEVPADLTRYLQQSGRIEATEEPAIHVLAGGVSNRTVLVQRATGQTWVMKQALAKLRVATDWFSSPARIYRETEGLRWLATLAPAGTITPLVFEDRALHIMAMQAVPQPHTNWKTLLLAGNVDTDHITQFGHLLGTIHRQAYEQRATLMPVFQDTTFFETLRVEPYYTFTASQVPAAAQFITTLIAETRAHHLTLVHGDYSPKNILVHHGKLVLLDHEVIHWGDPAFDLGFSLTHLLSKAHHLPLYRQVFAAAARQYWTTYRQTLGDVEWTANLENRAVRHTLACMLARVAGRSPLEYLSMAERSRQRDIITTLMQQIPVSIAALLDEFLERIDKSGNHQTSDGTGNS